MQADLFFFGFSIWLLEDSPATLLDEFWAISLLDVPTASLLSGAGPTAELLSPITEEQLSPYTGEAVNESEEVSSEQATTPNNKVGIIPQRIFLNIQHSFLFYYKI
jgi:hypothetical protein